MRLLLLSFSILFFAYINAADQQGKPRQETKFDLANCTITTIYGKNDGSVLAIHKEAIVQGININSDIWKIRADRLDLLTDIENIIDIARQFKKISRLELHCENYKDIFKLHQHIKEQAGPQILSIGYDINI